MKNLKAIVFVLAVLLLIAGCQLGSVNGDSSLPRLNIEDIRGSHRGTLSQLADIPDTTEETGQAADTGKTAPIFTAGIDDRNTDAIIDEFEIEGKKDRVNIEWDSVKVAAISDDIESFVFKYTLPIDNPNGEGKQYVDWTTEASPDTGKFITDCGDLNKNSVYSFKVYVRYKDHTDFSRSSRGGIRQYSAGGHRYENIQDC